MAATFRSSCAGLAFLTLAGFLSPLGAQTVATPIENAAARARHAFERGDFETAAALWSATARRGGVRQRVEALAGASAAHQALGQINPALERAQQALAVARGTGERPSLALSHARLGSLYVYTRRGVLAESHLQQALDLATQIGDRSLAARIWNDRGNLRATQEQNEQARQSYTQSAALASDAGDAVVAARAKANLAALLARTPRGTASSGAASSGATDDASRTAEVLMRPVAPSHDKAQILMALANAVRAAARASEPGSPPAETNARRALELFAQARQVAHSIGDTRSLSLALGYTGQVLEEQVLAPGGEAPERARIEEALRLTRQARFLAQQAGSPLLLFAWEWQTGRLLRAQGQTDPAIDALRRAGDTLQELCDCAGYQGALPALSALAPVTPGAARGSSATAVFYQLADLLLQKAAASESGDVVGAQKYLMEARDSVERQRGAELRDYFNDSCVAAGLGRVRDVEAVLQDAAAVYFVPLPDRTEILLGLPTGLRRFSSPIGAAALAARARRLRLLLSRAATERYRAASRELYDALIRPLEDTLQQNKIQTLVLIPDGALRTIPLAALHDGEQFLVEKFSLATAPGLTLLDPRPLARQDPQVLAGGVSKAVQGFPALDGVPREMANLARSRGATVLLNENFGKAAAQSTIARGEQAIVHIASHGQFSSNPDDTFLLAFDGKLSLGDLEAVIRPRQFRGFPVEMLVLSACETAAGDDRAALGLAGVAIRSGARSALATLWSVSDEATTLLIERFYANLKKSNVSKARALQQAQIELLRDPRFEHPAFWSAYLVIGNWL
jgi:CHAT domain-containing protein